jgi:hypothetical protein
MPPVSGAVPACDRALALLAPLVIMPCDAGGGQAEVWLSPGVIH